jgi:CheY-like chemotaxis protein
MHAHEKLTSQEKNLAPLKQMKKILIADDVYENRFLFKHYMREFGYEMVEANSGKEAIELFDDTIDAVFLDLSFPDMSGFDAFEIMKPHRKLSQKIIAFSASTDQSGKDRCAELGFDGYVSKPFDTKSIVDSLIL